MGDNKPIAIDRGILRELAASDDTVSISASDQAIKIQSPSRNTFLIGFDEEIAKVPSLKESYVAGESISALQVVYVSLDGKAYRAGSQGTMAQALAIGIAVTSSPSGGEIEVLITGIIFDAGWSFTLNGLVFLDENGNISMTAPTNGYLVRLGKVLTPKSIFINVQEPIEL